MIVVFDNRWSLVSLLVTQKCRNYIVFESVDLRMMEYDRHDTVLSFVFECVLQVLKLHHLPWGGIARERGERIVLLSHALSLRSSTWIPVWPGNFRHRWWKTRIGSLLHFESNCLWWRRSLPDRPCPGYRFVPPRRPVPPTKRHEITRFA